MSEYSHLRIPLLTLLSHPRCRQSLRSFALQEHSEETICFIEDVEGLRELYTAWRAEKDRTQQQHSALAGNGDGQSELKLPAELELAAEEDDSLAAPVCSVPESPAHSTRSVNSVSLQSPLHRHSLLLSGVGNRRDSDTAALRDFTFPITAAAASSSSSSAVGLRLIASRSSIVNARGQPVSAVGLVTEAAMKIWSKYQPGSQWAVSWHPEQLRAVQSAIKAGGGRLDSPLLFNGQEELEIENVQGGTLSRFYATNDYRRLCDGLLTELALSVQHALAAAQTSKFSANPPVHAKPAVAAPATSVLQSASLLSAIAETKERKDSRLEGRLNGTVNMSTILRMDTALSVSCTPTGVSSPASPRDGCDSPASPASPPAVSHAPLRLRKGRSLLSLNLQQEADAALSEADSEDEWKTATPPLRQSSSLHILLPRRSLPVTAATEEETGLKAAPRLQAIRKVSEVPSPSSPPADRVRSGSSALGSPASPSCSSPAAGELELLCQHGFFLFHFSPLGSQLLRAYMGSEWSLDNYDCLLAIDAFSSRAMSDGCRRREAKAIFHSFLSVHSKHEVTFPSDMRAELTRALSLSQTPLPCGLFDPVFDVVLQTVRIDVFRRFVRSAAYQKLSARMRDRLSPPAAKPCSLPAVSRVSQVSLGPSALSFADVLNDSELLSAYTAFCQHEHSEENVLFYQSAQRYRELDRSDPEEINLLVQRIYARHVVENSDYEVHFPLQLKTELKREMAYPHPELYDKAIAFVVAVMREDSGKRFLANGLECRNAVRKRGAS